MVGTALEDVTALVLDLNVLKGQKISLPKLLFARCHKLNDTLIIAMKLPSQHLTGFLTIDNLIITYQALNPVRLLLAVITDLVIVNRYHHSDKLTYLNVTRVHGTVYTHLLC